MLRVISEGSWEVDEELRAGFVDWRKIFDCVKCTRIIQSLEGTGIDWQERRLISICTWIRVLK
jgi:hypothetical protein